MPDVNPTTLAVAELLSRLEARDFEPFAIIMSDGSQHHVPSAGHCFVTRILRRIEVEHDDGRVTFVAPLHIAKLEVQRNLPHNGKSVVGSRQ